LKQIQLLNLNGNEKIGDEGLRFLIKSLHQIKQLGLSRCNLGDESVRLISERLMETKHEVSWGLWCNKKYDSICDVTVKKH